jgi:hypothetical protein
VIAFAALATLLAGCAAMPAAGDGAGRPPALDSPPVAFWNSLQALCGQAFAGRALVHPPDETALLGTLVMHVRECSADEIRIPLHAGEDRSRTWVVRRVGDALELKHIHRYEDGRESSNSRYGGTTRLAGTPYRQEFRADAFSIEAVPGRASQWWFLEIYPGGAFAYGLFREETALRYRIEFDLQNPVPAPPPPWGS